MKEKYLSPDNIDAVSAKMLSEVSGYSTVKPFSLNSSGTALLVLDMQKYFMDETSHAFIPSGKAIIKNISKLADLFVKKKAPVIFTKHINAIGDANMMSSWWNDMITQDNILSEIIPELYADSEQVIVKTQYDAFYNTELDEILKQKSVTDVIITGVMTHLCCENTARSAFVRGYRVLFPIDATATYNYNFHLASVLNLSHGYAHITFTNNILEQS